MSNSSGAGSLDARLEKVMETHHAENKQAAEEPRSGLRDFAMRPSIAEEIAVVRGKVASTDFNVIRAAETMDNMLEQRAVAGEDLRDALKLAAEQYRDELGEQAAVDNHIATLRGAHSRS